MHSKRLVQWGTCMNLYKKYILRGKTKHCSMYEVKHIQIGDNHKNNFSSKVVHSPFVSGDIPEILISELITDIVDGQPDATALRCGLTGRSYNYAVLQKLSQRFANSLMKAGFTHGEAIAVILTNCPEFAIVTLGALQADLIVTFMNHAYTPDEICHQIKDSETVCIVSSIEHLPVVQSSIAKLKENYHSNPIRKVIAMDIPSPTSLPEGIARFSEAIADYVDHSRERGNRSKPKDLALMPYSSGTTGMAKGVCLSHNNIVSCLYQIYYSGFSSWIPDNGQFSALGLLPFFHIYGFLVLLNSIKHGWQLVSMPKFEPEAFVHILESDKLSMLFLVPPLVKFLGLYPVIERKKHLSHARLVVVGADVIEVAALEKLKAKLPPDCHLAQGYGMTELSGFATFPTFPVKNLVTCGAPGALTEGKVISQDSGTDLGPHQTGELCFRGPQVMLGYKNNPQATAEMVDKDGWLRTGDIGYYDNNNHFYIEGRIKELIKVKGFQVPPAELEAVLRSHPGIKDAAVIGVPDPRTGETPIAYVVRSEGSTLNEGQVKEYLGGKVARHKQVSKVFFVDKIPKTAAGKIIKKELREWFEHIK